MPSLKLKWIVLLLPNNNNNTSRTDRGTHEAGCVQQRLLRGRQEVGQNGTGLCFVICSVYRLTMRR